MIRISDKSLCCGCTACVSVCPASCIVMRRDREGFDYPVANPDRCLNCGLCEKICPVLNPPPRTEPMVSYAARCEDILERVSSGGVFQLLAEEIINQNGVVCGAALDHSCAVEHREVETIKELDALRGSKYVQSELYSIYEDVRCRLDEQCKVLFSGTPCQIAGLKVFLKGDHPHLYTVDIACHGVPSPGLWEKYRTALVKKHSSVLKSVDFRDKSDGWRHYNIRYEFEDKQVKVSRMKDPYLALFLQNMTLRPSCYDCRLRNGHSGSDITLADLWSVAGTMPELNDDRGVSGVLINTEKGRLLYDRIAGRLIGREVMAEAVMAENGGFASGLVQIPQRREEFFKGVHSAADMLKYMTSFVVRKPLPVRIYRQCMRLLSSLKRRILK